MLRNYAVKCWRKLLGLIKESRQICRKIQKSNLQTELFIMKL